MTTISIPLSDDEYALLKDRAERAGVSLEDLLRRLVEGYLSRPDVTFDSAARQVLDKNEAIYRWLF